MAGFLQDHESELQSHALIAKDNIKALQQQEEEILKNVRLAFNIVDVQKGAYGTCLRMKVQNNLTRFANFKNKQEILSIAETINKKEKSIANLEKQLNTKSNELAAIKIKIEEDNRNDHKTMKAFQKAIQTFTKRFQYSIKISNSNDDNKYCITIVFKFNNVSSNHPVKFIFSRQTSELLEFDARSLLSDDQHKKLGQRYKETNNNLALICTLRNIAYRKCKE